MIPPSIFLPLLSVLQFQSGTGVVIGGEGRQQCCQCSCCVCKNICEPGRNRFGVLGNGAAPRGSAINHRKGVPSTVRFGDGASSFRNSLPFVPSAGKPQILTEVSQPKTDVDYNLVPDVPENINEFSPVADSENDRQVTSTKLLPAPANYAAVDKYFRENDMQSSNSEQLVSGQSTSSDQFPKTSFHNWSDNSVLDHDDNKHYNVMNQPFTTNDINDVNMNRKDREKPAIRADFCASSCDGHTCNSCDYDPYLGGTFSGLQTFPSGMSAQEPEGKVVEELQQQNALEYYDEVEHERNDRTTFPPNFSSNDQQVSELDFMAISPKNICHLCDSGTVQNSPPLQLENRSADVSFTGRYGSRRISPLNSMQARNNNNSSPGTSHTMDDNELKDSKTFQLLKSSSFVDLNDKLTPMTAAQAVPLVGDFRSHNDSPLVTDLTKGTDKTIFSPPSLLALERRLNNDTKRTYMKQSTVAGLKTQTMKTTEGMRTTNNVVITTFSNSRRPTSKPPNKFTGIQGNRAASRLVKPHQWLSNGSRNDATVTGNYLLPTDTYQFLNTRNFEQREFPSHPINRQKEHTSGLYHDSIGSKMQHGISNAPYQLFQSPSVQQNNSIKFRAIPTAPTPTEDSLLNPPMENHMLSGKITRTRKAKLFREKFSNVPVMN